MTMFCPSDDIVGGVDRKVVPDGDTICFGILIQVGVDGVKRVRDVGERDGARFVAKRHERKRERLVRAV